LTVKLTIDNMTIAYSQLPAILLLLLLALPWLHWELPTSPPRRRRHAVHCATAQLRALQQQGHISTPRGKRTEARLSHFCLHSFMCSLNAPPKKIHRRGSYTWTYTIRKLSPYKKRTHRWMDRFKQRTVEKDSTWHEHWCSCAKITFRCVLPLLNASSTSYCKDNNRVAGKLGAKSSNLPILTFSDFESLRVTSTARPRMQHQHHKLEV
jgi:hypothetical protein